MELSDMATSSERGSSIRRRQRTKRPVDSAFRQQKLSAFQPILTPRVIILTLGVIGCACVLTGSMVVVLSQKVVQAKVQYDGVDTASRYEACKVDGFDQFRRCEVRLKVPRKMRSPVDVYYELSNVRQNHRRYSTSINFYQLMGDQKDRNELSSCAPLKVNESRTLNPCGLIANSMFSDKFDLTSHTMKERGIALWSDKKKLDQPDDFDYAVVDDDDDVSGCVFEPCDDALCSKYGLPATCFGYECQDYEFENGKCDTGDAALFYYPEPYDYQYLWQTYPYLVSPLVGVKNEHFIVWMRTAALPHFRKIYGRITHTLHEHEVLTFNVTANFWARKFDGRKWLVVSTQGPIGGKNIVLGVGYLILGAVCLSLSLAFLALQHTQPRRVGDVSQAITTLRA
ncbi:hypothetical protein CTAYLR_003477 [Chrysophaeum taylorii]|uniref:Uncharacterized protein n=1 Tax=Chrysophaeum taylorii TaxID=2483200 RepID=A0AAD7U961_9STRA|nr:hypothetical protein CTAYLR_003477 [Chrysophaeum taylorii]